MKFSTKSLAKEIAIKDLKSEGYKILSPKKVMSELPTSDVGFTKKPKLGFKNREL